MRIGIPGTGHMGRAIAERLMECGHDVHVWNRTAQKTAPLVEIGAKRVETPKDLADAVDVVITALTDAAALDAVFDGPSGLLAGGIDSKLFIEMSTVRPETQVKLADRVRGAGGAYLECAVSGSVGPARQGKLIGLVGGADEDVARARPVLDRLCRRVEHIGPVGSGASVKLAVNLPLALYFQTLGEAYSLCRHVGRDPAWLIDLLSETSGGPNLLKTRGTAIAEALRGGDPPPAFGVDGVVKDLRTMVAEAEARGVGLPLAETALSIYEEASRKGWAGRDGATLAAYWPSRAASESH
jgi:3-hydroxyisobutyrate dehydrogenase